MRVLVIGVGTRHGDDAAGLAAAERLGRLPLPAGASVTTCERPLDLVELLDGAEAVVVVDALHSGGEPGRLRWLGAGELSPAAGLSTHALGVAEALGLAKALGRVPARLEILGIEAGGPESGPADRPMRPAVERAAARAAERIRDRLEALLAAGGAGPPARGGPRKAREA